MTHYMTKHFQQNLARFRKIADLSRAEVCDRMAISHKTYNRLNVIYRRYRKSTQYLKAFLIQQSELRKMVCGLESPAFILNHLYGTEVIQRGESAQPFIELLKRYSDEWESVISSARMSGIAWTRLVEPDPNLMQGVNRVSA